MDNAGVEGYALYCSLDEDRGNDAVLIQVTGEVSYLPIPLDERPWILQLPWCTSQGKSRHYGSVPQTEKGKIITIMIRYLCHDMVIAP